MGKPIVSSRIGAEGIDVEHEKDILLSDDPREFADHVCRVLDDPELATRLGRSARETVVESYSWRASAEKMEALFEDLVRARTGEQRRPAASRPAPV
jgi:glycosyltransferase involved in cell wall biosynthesis